MFGFLGAVVCAAVAAEINFHESIKHLPEDAQLRLRARRREWLEALQRQAEEAARANESAADPALVFLTGVALGVGLA